MALPNYAGALAVLEAGVRNMGQTLERAADREFRLKQLEYQLMFNAYEKIRQEADKREQMVMQTRNQLRQLGISMDKIDQKAPEAGSTGRDAKEALAQKKDTLEGQLLAEYKRVQHLREEQSRLESALDKFGEAFAKGKKKFFEYSTKDQNDKLGQYNLSMAEMKMLSRDIAQAGIEPGTIAYEGIMAGAIAMSKDYAELAGKEAMIKNQEEQNAIARERNDILWARLLLDKARFEAQQNKGTAESKGVDPLDVLRSQAEQARAIFSNAKGDDPFIPVPNSLGTNTADVHQAFSSAALPYINKVYESLDGELKKYDKELYKFIDAIGPIARGETNYVEYNGKIYTPEDAAAFIAGRIHENSIPADAFNLKSFWPDPIDYKVKFKAATDYVYNLARYQVGLDVASGNTPTINVENSPFSGTKSQIKRITPEGVSRVNKNLPDTGRRDYSNPQFEPKVNNVTKNKPNTFKSAANLAKSTAEVVKYALPADSSSITGRAMPQFAGLGSVYSGGPTLLGQPLIQPDTAKYVNPRDIARQDFERFRAGFQGLVQTISSIFKPDPGYKKRLKSMSYGLEEGFRGSLGISNRRNKKTEINKRELYASRQD